MTTLSKSIAKREIIGFCFALPAIVLFAIISLIPIVQAFIVSFFDWSLFNKHKKFIWIENYIKMFENAQFFKSIIVTSKWTLIVVPSIIAFSLLIAVILNNKMIKLKGLYRTIYFIPVVTNMVAAAFVWKWLFEPTNGVVNYILKLFNISGPGWLADPKYALYAMMVVGIWKQIGFAMVIFLAGLQTIPSTLYEASTIDGANKWNVFTKITIPLLNPTVVFVSVMLIINAFRVFTIPYVMSAGGFSYGIPGGPLDSTRVFVIHVYDLGFRQHNFGYASANSFFLLAVILILTLLQLKLLQKPFEY